jgi:hydroxyacylglutathione hydrolase
MGVYLRQLLAGRDIAKSNSFAREMANFVYLVGDEETRECMVVDPAWDVGGVIDYVEREDVRLTGALVTHYHPDHVGGHIFGYEISGLADLLSICPVPVYVNAIEADGVKQVTGLSDSDLRKQNGGDSIVLGSTVIRFLHTPGHTPGSQCFLLDSSLISGDTLFLGGCGRVDLPGGDATQMYYSLTQILAKLPDGTSLYPGHNYASKQVGSIGEEKQVNQYLRIKSLEEWLRLMT